MEGVKRSRYRRLRVDAQSSGVVRKDDVVVEQACRTIRHRWLHAARITLGTFISTRTFHDRTPDSYLFGMLEDIHGSER